jgi:hypothetical protein
MYRYYNCPNVIIDADPRGEVGTPGATVEAAQYEEEVCRQIAGIERTRVGAAVVDAIRSLPTRTLRIVPFEGEIPDAAERAESPQDATLRGQPVIEGAKNQVGRILSDDATGKPVLGTGAGSNAGIAYTATRFFHHHPVLTWRIQRQREKGRRPTDETLCRPGDDADEFLLHEMVHGLRNMAGVSHARPMVGTLTRYDNEEEFFAILVTNIYMSEKGERLLRRDHRGHYLLGKDLDTSREFLRDVQNASLVQKLYTQQRALCRHIAAVRCRFNPIRIHARLNDD